MKRSVLFMVLLSLGFQASAVPVTANEAARAARTWARSGATLSARVGTSVAEAETITVTNGISVYAVRLVGGGTAFVSSDTEVEPIVAFTSRSDVDLSAESPLVQLLGLDAIARRRLAGLSATPSSATAQTGATASAASASSAGARRWSALLGTVSAATAGGVSEETAASELPLLAVNDVRVAPLLQSQWNQESGGGGYCWNYYTPNNLPCGCTATAAGQIMRYFQWPTAEMAPATYDCSLEGETVRYTTMGGVYDWSAMPYVLMGIVPEAQRQQIGRLVYDIGVTLQTSYSEAGGGSASPTRLGELYRTFKYADGYVFWDGRSYYTGEGGLHSLALRERIVYANLDAKRPVQFAIYGYPKSNLYDSRHWAGHSVVGDGYGFNVIDDVKTAYVHINMGWGGTDDVWYNIPEIDAANSGAHVGESGYDFLYMGGGAFNLSTEEAGKDILSGRVIDDEGNGVSGARVAASLNGAVVKAVTTDANGVYALTLDGDQTYDLSAASADGNAIADQDGVFLRKTVGNSSFIVSSSANVGNSWGNDLTLGAPCARIVLGAVTNVYTTLDKAIAAAKTFVSAGAPGAQIEILDAIPLTATTTIDFPCALTAVGTDPAMMPVVRNGNAALAVAAGGTLALSNVTFATQTSTAVTVADGGRLVVAADVDLGVPSSVAAVSTATSDGFVLAADLANGFAIDCAAAPDVNGVFGTAICDYLVASNCAAKISNVRDTLGETRGIAVAEGSAVLLKWGEIPVPLSESVGYFVDASGATNTAARLDRLLEKFQNMQTSGDVGETGEIVVRKRAGLELTKRFAVTGNLTLRGETAGVTIGAGAAAGFDVGTGATVNVRDLTFDGYRGDSLFLVNGGALTVGGETTFTNIEGTNTYSGAIAVLSGKATVGSDGGVVVFDGCVNNAANSRGGAIYLKDSTSELVLQDRVIITNCQARSAGGGVYMGKAAKVRLSGYLTIQGNVIASNKANDISYYRTSASAAHTLILSGLLETGSAVGIRGDGLAASSVLKAGGVFLAVDAAFTDRAQILQSCEWFFCDTDAALAAKPSDDYTSLQWEQDDGSIKPVDPSVAVACVTADGTSAYYGSLADAFGVLTGDATVKVLADTTLSDDVTVTTRVTLTSGTGGPFVVSRAAPCQFNVLTNGALTVTGLEISGELDALRYGTGLLFDVQYGELTLGDGAVVRDVTSGTERAGGAIKVYKGALTMLDGSAIRNCTNRIAGNSRGGAVAADSSSRVRLLGGTVADCVSDRGGGVYIGNETTVEIGGGFVATDNTATDGSPNNLYVASKSTLLLVSPFTGRVGYVPGVTASSNVFGRVATDFSGTAAQIANSAHNFMHDLTGDVGFAVKGGGETWLVWSDALGADGKVTVDDTTYEPVSGGTTLTTEIADVVTSFVYDGTAKICLSSDHGYILTCVAQTNAGSYTATATPKAGFTWADGTTAARTISWTIAKAVYDMSGVTFVDQTFIYDGNPHALAISGTLPTGVTVAYTIVDSTGNSQPGNEKTESGVYTVTATFTGDAANYEPIPALTAALTIAEKVDPPDPDPPTPVTTNYPTPIAFRAITRVSDTKWTLEITNRVPWCHYRLLATDDLTKGFVTTGAWERAAADAAPVWTTNVITTGGAQFWKAEAKEGIVEE